MIRRFPHLAWSVIACWGALAVAGAPLPTGTTPAGERVSPFKVGPSDRAVVLFFLAPDCPISNRYVPRINELTTEFTAQGVISWLVFSDDLADADHITAHLTAVSLLAPAVIDRDFAVADYAGADVTPEAAVFVVGNDHEPRLVYRGRIDDQYEGFGRYRPTPNHNDLRNVLARVVQGDAPSDIIVTKAIGCYIPRPHGE